MTARVLKKIQTHNRFKITLFSRTKYNMDRDRKMT